LAQAEVVPAHLRIEIVVERSHASVLELDAHQAGATGDGRGHFLDDTPFTPLAVVAMRDEIAEAKVQTEAVGAHAVPAPIARGQAARISTPCRTGLLSGRSTGSSLLPRSTRRRCHDRSRCVPVAPGAGRTRRAADAPLR